MSSKDSFSKSFPFFYKGGSHIGTAGKYLQGRTYSAEDLRGQTLELFQLRSFPFLVSRESLARVSHTFHAVLQTCQRRDGGCHGDRHYHVGGGREITATESSRRRRRGL